MAIDYFTKWIEANLYANVTAKNIAKFIKRDIIARYGTPQAVITDNGSNLNNKVVDDLLDRFKIRHLNSSPYRPQMNGAVEAANKNIKKILAKDRRELSGLAREIAIRVNGIPNFNSDFNRGNALLFSIWHGGRPSCGS